MTFKKNKLWSTAVHHCQVRVIRMILTPNGINNTLTLEIDSDLVKIEDRLNLNSQKPERLPELLFPTNEELLNMSINNSILTSTQNLRNNSSPEKKIEASGKIMVLTHV